METNRSTSDAGGQPSRENHASANRGVCYGGSARLIDVMFDQLEYLIAHSRRNCPSGCRDCERLEQVSNWLLTPFACPTAASPQPSRCVGLMGLGGAGPILDLTRDRKRVTWTLPAPSRSF